MPSSQQPLDHPRDDCIDKFSDICISRAASERICHGEDWQVTLSRNLLVQHERPSCPMLGDNINGICGALSRCQLSCPRVVIHQQYISTARTGHYSPMALARYHDASHPEQHWYFPVPLWHTQGHVKGKPLGSRLDHGIVTVHVMM